MISDRSSLATPIPTILIGRDVELVELSEDHAPLLAEWLGDPENAHFTNLDIPAAMSVHQARALIEGQQRDQGAWFQMLRHYSSGQLVGYGGLVMIDQKNRSAMFGLIIGRLRERNQGLGQDALALLLRYAFAELNLHRVWGEVLAFNTVALSAFEKVGMQREGVKRQACYRSGAYRDVVVVSILASEWREAG